MSAYISLKSLVLSQFGDGVRITVRECLSRCQIRDPKITLAQVRGCVNTLKRESLLRNDGRIGREIMLEGNVKGRSYPSVIVRGGLAEDVANIDLIVIYLNSVRERLLLMDKVMRGEG